MMATDMQDKTLNYAPKWSRDVAVLLNVKSDDDWRLLASRLGYSNDDIRNWATQPDPCLSMFDEWFTTNKTRAVTHAILKALEEMNRTDAGMIVENALKQTEYTADDEEVDYVTPPPVFLSYHWRAQDEVKLLKKHLEMAGFECWMDIGQMGGGDKLFKKIDTGIREAKIVICCVTKKYAKSANCRREVNLSVNLGKPIIPLLMEKMSWPPAGSMGPIFGENPAIKFFSRNIKKGETVGDIRYWRTAKFQELLMQLRYSVIPNESIITDPYNDWCLPPEELTHIEPTYTNSTAIDKSQGDPDSPDVFISYEWEKQPQVKALYKTLTLMGYRCWLDIMQMGGGDSMYDKIDKGVRGCKVVLTCVTTKYSLSANCRREVSLADALKKPIVPLLLDKMTWPPEGPMSMVYAQLLYINFYKPDISVQEIWDCPQMEHLLSKISAHIPTVKEIKSILKKKESTPSAVAPPPPPPPTVKEIKTVIVKKKEPAPSVAAPPPPPPPTVKVMNTVILKKKEPAPPAVAPPPPPPPTVKVVKTVILKKKEPAPVAAAPPPPLPPKVKVMKPIILKKKEPAPDVAAPPPPLPPTVKVMKPVVLKKKEPAPAAAAPPPPLPPTVKVMKSVILKKKVPIPAAAAPPPPLPPTVKVMKPVILKKKVPAPSALPPLPPAVKVKEKETKKKANNQNAPSVNNQKPQSNEPNKKSSSCIVL